MFNKLKTVTMKNILLTGPPGVGKTTLVKKIADKLSAQQTAFNGFYTEEVRINNRRVGFDIVTLDGRRAILARKSSTNELPSIMPTVGQYSVYLKDFEKLALPIFEKPTDLIIIDEIGKMESYSRRFQDGVLQMIENKDVKVIATVPVKGGPALVQQLIENKDSRLITVNQKNRDELLGEIVKLITEYNIFN